MDLIRHRNGWITAALFVCQLAALVVVPVVMCRDGVEASTAVACTCTHADGGPCPMHTHAVRAAAPARRECACRGTANPSQALLAALLGSPAIVPAANAAEPLTSQPLSLESRAGMGAIVPVPDGPPPRA